jgi:hypothetical protein
MLRQEYEVMQLLEGPKHLNTARVPSQKFSRLRQNKCCDRDALESMRDL